MTSIKIKIKRNSYVDLVNTLSTMYSLASQLDMDSKIGHLTLESHGLTLETIKRGMERLSQSLDCIAQDMSGTSATAERASK